MDAISKEILTEAVKHTTLAVLDMLIKHNIKGAQLIKDIQISSASAHTTKIEDHYKILLDIISLLQPVFNLVGEWLAAQFPCLLSLFTWAKDVWESAQSVITAAA
jgi:hypothetical protein